MLQYDLKAIASVYDMFNSFGFYTIKPQVGPWIMRLTFQLRADSGPHMIVSIVASVPN